MDKWRFTFKVADNLSRRAGEHILGVRKNVIHIIFPRRELKKVIMAIMDLLN